MKSVLIAIQPKWCELIASGKKTIEVRKTAPKLQTPFKCYIYCTLSGSNEIAKDLNKWYQKKWYNKKGKVIPEKKWVADIVKLADQHGTKVFMKESLRKIMGDDFRRDRLPWEVQ